YYSVSLSPNPAQGTVKIELTETPLDETGKAMLQSENRHTTKYQEYSFDSHPSRIRIFDINGVERFCLEEVPESNTYNLDIVSLSPGIYVVHLEHKNGIVVRQLRVE